MTASAKTLRALERAAMRWLATHPHVKSCDCYECRKHKPLYRACASHAAALKRKRTGRR